jgi:hypothetical protein
LDFRFEVAELRFRWEFDRSRNAPDAGYIPRCMIFACLPFFASRPCGSLPVANRSGCCGTPIAKVAVCGPVAGLIAALRLHFPSGWEAFWVLLALSDETR